MGFVITEYNEIVELGTTVRTSVSRAIGSIRWLDRTVHVDALVSNEPAANNRPDTARALIDTELLANCLLLVDFRTHLVEIETQA